VAGQLDGFRAAVDQFAPLVILSDLAGPIDANSLPPAAGSVRVSVLALSDAVLAELDGILADREADLGQQRELTVGAGIAVLVATLLLWWLAVTLARRRPGGSPAVEPADIAPTRVTVVPTEAAGEPVPAELVDVRNLLDLDELVGFPRAVRTRQPGSDEDHAG
jgi:hypothetical protein